MPAIASWSNAFVQARQRLRQFAQDRAARAVAERDLRREVQARAAGDGRADAEHDGQHCRHDVGWPPGGRGGITSTGRHLAAHRRHGLCPAGSDVCRQRLPARHWPHALSDVHHRAGDPRSARADRAAAGGRVGCGLDRGMAGDGRGSEHAGDHLFPALPQRALEDGAGIEGNAKA